MNEKNNGRYYIKSLKTGKTYCVEAIHHSRPRTDFGESLHDFCDGSIKEKESIINESNCLNLGYSKNPMDYIDRLEKQN